MDIVGDSTANADLIPSRIGAGVRAFGLGGGTPVEAYYVVRSLLKCPDRPKAVILMFTPSGLGNNPEFPQPPVNFYLSRAFLNESINFQEALEVLKYARHFNSSFYANADSVFYADYKVTALSYWIKFPPYYWPYLQTYLKILLKGHRQSLNASNAQLYEQAVLDDGHFFYGTAPDGGAPENAAGVFDHDAFRTNVGIPPLSDFYVRRTIEDLTRNGVRVFLAEPPRNIYSFAHYNSGLADVYQNYLANLQSSEPGVRLLGTGFQVWSPVYFGDSSHLNLRGSLVFSDMVRQLLGRWNLPVTLYDDDDMKTVNSYGGGDPAAAFWMKLPADTGSSVNSAGDTVLPELAYPAADTAWLYNIHPQKDVDRPSGIQAPSAEVAANTVYAISVLVKNVNADAVSLQLNWPGGIGEKISWNFSRRQAIRSGRANKVNNGGILFCPGGWIELFLTDTTGTMAGNYPGPVVSLSAPHDAAAYIYNMTLERSLWPTNYCPLQAGEAKTILAAAKTNSTIN